MSENYNSVANQLLTEQYRALELLALNIPHDFHLLVEQILKLKGNLIVSGVGKSGHIARKISSTFTSTGTRSFFVHPTEASHGDLGNIRCGDLVIILSVSGETKELLNLINHCKCVGALIAIFTMCASSSMALISDFILSFPIVDELAQIPAPTISSLMMLAIGDALATTVHQARGFSEQDFALYHPGGKIGSDFLLITEIMRKGDEIPFSYLSDSFKEIVSMISEKKLGCTLIIDENKSLLGIITDGDLRRFWLQTHQNTIDMAKYTASALMTHTPKIIHKDSSLKQAMHLMRSYKISILPVIENNIVIGIAHLQDLLKY